jgi:ArsR family transcriptional regulator
VNNALRGFKAELFKALAHPTRIHILELLRPGEKTVSELQGGLGIEASSVSQQLGTLRAMHIVEGRKQATSVFYRVSDPNVFTLLDVARDMFDKRLIELQSMVEEAPGADEAAPLTGARI